MGNSSALPSDGTDIDDAVILGQFRITGYQAAWDGQEVLNWICATTPSPSDNPGPLWVEDVLQALYRSDWILDTRSKAKLSRRDFTARVKRMMDYIASRTAERDNFYRATGEFQVSSEDV
jgi:hypothetical protein